jgi:Uma2 family endonuclease
MAAAHAPLPPPTWLTLHLLPGITLTEEQFETICEQNRDLRIERNEAGDLILMPPTGGQTGDRNSELNMQLRLWAKTNGDGRVFDSSTGFILPNGANRSPDAAWVSRPRLVGIPVEQRGKFLPLCPDFVVELRSPTDSLNDLTDKMKEYLSNGTKLGWLIDPAEQRLHVFRPGTEAQILDAPERISGDPELPGFELVLAEIWNPVW